MQSARLHPDLLRTMVLGTRFAEIPRSLTKENPQEPVDMHYERFANDGATPFPGTRSEAYRAGTTVTAAGR